MGHWDVMVLIEALKSRQMKIFEHIVIRRQHHVEFQKKLTELENQLISVEANSLVGIIVNETSTSWLMKRLSGSHWYALSLRTANDGSMKWFNCDSKIQQPVLVKGEGDNTAVADGSFQAILSYLKQRSQAGVGVQCFVVGKESESEVEIGS